MRIMRDAVGLQNLIPGHKSYILRVRRIYDLYKSYILRVRRIYDLCSGVTPTYTFIH